MEERKRDVNQLAQLGKCSIRANEGLTMSEFNELVKVYEKKSNLSGLLEAVETAYYMGYTVGIRNK